MSARSIHLPQSQWAPLTPGLSDWHPWSRAVLLLTLLSSLISQTLNTFHNGLSSARVTTLPLASELLQSLFPLPGRLNHPSIHPPICHPSMLPFLACPCACTHTRTRARARTHTHTSTSLFILWVSAQTPRRGHSPSYIHPPPYASHV